MTAITPLQANVLIQAHHGPLSMVKGCKSQTKALIRKGLLTPELTLTADGVDTYAELGRRLTWTEAISRLPYQYSSRSDTVRVCAPGLSADGRTAYLASRGADVVTVAIYVHTIPAEYLDHFGIGVA